MQIFFPFYYLYGKLFLQNAKLPAVPFRHTDGNITAEPTFLRQITGYADIKALVRFGVCGYNALFERFAVTLNGIFKLIPVKRGKIEAVGHGYAAVAKCNSERSVGVFYLVGSRLEGAVGEHHSVTAEVPVLRKLAFKVAAVFLNAVYKHGVVAPFPDTAADQLFAAVYFFPIVPNSAWAVAHSVSVLAHKIRAFKVFILRLFNNALNRRIHNRENVG